MIGLPVQPKSRQCDECDGTGRGMQSSAASCAVCAGSGMVTPPQVTAYVNPELVRLVEPRGEAGALLHFAQDHVMPVELPAKEVAARLLVGVSREFRPAFEP